MLKQVTDGVWVHESNFLQSNAVVVQGTDGVLLIDPGITSAELAVLAGDIEQLGQKVIAGYSTHPHWDHLLWHEKFGDAPRYGTVRGKKEITDFFANPDWRTQIVPLLPADLADQIPTDELFGKIEALPAGTTQLPWDGPSIQIIEHGGHAAGSAALFIAESGVLVAGDMLSDILTPFLEFDADDPVADYFAALDLFEGLKDVKFVIPGHGSVGNAEDLHTRIQQDRAYVQALQSGGGGEDARLITGSQKDLLASVHPWQVQQISEKNK